MKKLNRKGFAISTMLYGLLIVMVLLMSLLMSTISFSRSNSKKFVSNVIKDLEFRDVTPPIVNLKSKTPPESPNIFYTNIQQKISVTFQAEDEYGLDFTVSKYPAGFHIGSSVFPINCNLSNKISKTKAYIQCSYTIPEDNTSIGSIFITPPVVHDTYGNRSTSSPIPLGYTVQEDEIAPTVELLKSKSGQYYLKDWSDDFAKVRLCDNAPGEILSRNIDEKKNLGISIGNQNLNFSLIRNTLENKCLEFIIRPSFNTTVEGDLKIKVFGEEDGKDYGWKDKQDNVSKRFIFPSGITFVGENQIALHIEHYEKKTFSTGKEYSLEGNINMVSAQCSGQTFNYTPTLPTCKIGDKTLPCELVLDTKGKKLNYKIKVNSNNKETGSVSITIPEHIIEDCKGHQNSQVTLYSGSEFVDS